ncbi:MAG: glycosyltransferase family 39 protein [Acidimicrobiia bacterium]
MTRETRRFLVGLGAIAAVGLVIRVAFLFIMHHPYYPVGDALLYHSGANSLVDGKGFVLAFFLENGQQAQGASNPPLYVLWLAIPSMLGFRSPLVHQLWSCVLGLGTVALLGVLGRQLAGYRAGLIAAALAAIGPNVFYWDTVILSETMSLFVATLVVLLCYRYWRAPDTRGLLLVGLSCGAAALSRAELVLLVPFVLVPLALGSCTIDFAARLRRLVVAGLMAALVVAPWITYNVTRFDKPVFLSNGLGVTLAATQCDDAYYGEFTGLWSIRCGLRVQRTFPKGYDESERDAGYREAALDYLGDHLGRAPVVVLSRWGRSLGLYRPIHSVEFDHFPEGRDWPIAIGGLISFWVLGALSVYGAVLLRRRKVPVYPLVALPAIAMIAIGIAFSSSRYRSTAEPALAILAAVAIDAFIRRRRGESDPDPADLDDRNETAAGAATS